MGHALLLDTSGQPEAAPELALVPLADHLNHSQPGNTKWTWSNERESFLLSAASEIPVGTEPLISYGEKGQRQLLMQHGCTLDCDDPAVD